MLDQDLGSTAPHTANVLDRLEELYGSQLSRAELEELACSIAPYLSLTRLPWNEAVEKISRHYLQDGARVMRLLNNPNAPEWQDILEQIVRYAGRHSLFPKDADAISWPDLDAYADVQRKLSTYNFEGYLDHWITVIVINRLRRYWRDQFALKVGGPGIKGKAERAADQTHDQALPKTKHCLIESLDKYDWLIKQDTALEHVSGLEHVEIAELHRLITESVTTLADQKQDRLLPQLWQAFSIYELKLREIAASFDLPIWQVYRRLDQVRVHLRQDPAVQSWFTSTD